MKQFVIIIHLLIISIAMICAQQVTRNEAVTAAINNLKYYYQNQNISSIDSVYSYCRNGRTLIYEVHFDTGEIVLLSGHKDCQPILGCVFPDDESEVSTHQKTQTLLSLGDDCPDGLKIFIEEYIQQIENCFTHSMTYSFASEWEDLQRYDENKARNIIIITPLTTTKWGQRESNDATNYAPIAYNYYSPSGQNCSSQCDAGCGPVALAQILRYWQSPNQVPNICHSYQWNYMPDELFYNGGNNQNYILQRDAIAQLIRDCGDAMNATYCNTNCATSAYTNMVPSALKKFRFNEAYMSTEAAAGNHATWVNMLVQELVNSRPVFYAAYDYSVTPHRGHGFVCDGYYKDVNNHDYFNFNWGWNGDYNSGYFTLPYLNPGTHNYPDAHEAIFNIQPSNCWENIIFSCDKYFIHQNQTFNAENTIQNNYHVFAVLQDSHVTLKAGDEIILTDGFRVGNGGIFVAKIEACEPDDGDGMPNLEDGIGERALRGDGACPTATTNDGTLRLHPNPTGGILTVESASPIRTLTVYDLAGRVMMTVDGGTVETCHGASLQVDVSSLPNGIYLLRAVTDNGVETGRFVKN